MNTKYITIRSDLNNYQIDAIRAIALSQGIGSAVRVLNHRVEDCPDRWFNSMSDQWECSHGDRVFITLERIPAGVDPGLFGEVESDKRNRWRLG